MAVRCNSQKNRFKCVKTSAENVQLLHLHLNINQVFAVIKCRQVLNLQATSSYEYTETLMPQGYLCQKYELLSSKIQTDTHAQGQQHDLNNQKRVVPCGNLLKAKKVE